MSKKEPISDTAEEIQTCKGLRQHGGPFKKYLPIKCHKKTTSKKKTAKTTRIQRNSRMSRNNAEQQIDCCKKEQKKVKSLIKDKKKEHIYTNKIANKTPE
jgi:hypothetical protein